MKTTRNLAPLLAVVLAPLVGGCNATSTNPPAATNTASEVVTQPESALAESSPSAQPTVAEGKQPEVPFGVERPLPANLSPSPSLHEVIKLTQAGVADDVVVTFINNSTTPFNLAADDIVFLNDIGLGSPVINAMIERDKIILVSKAQSPGIANANAALASFASNAQPATVAAAPTYINQPPAGSPPTVVEQPVAEVTDDSFNSSLSPYGTWIDVEGYGRCWQPSVVVVNPYWRPYCDGGHWIYTDSGWYWYSEYSWGWAPFHYGRWFSHPRWGWCWYPGYTWGPAWVSWRYSDTYCGWAPLPPAAVYTTGVGFTYYGSSVSVSFGFDIGYDCYSFVSWNHFCDYRPWRYCEPRPRCHDIYNNSTCHNDYGYSRNRTVVNRGVPAEKVVAHTRTPLKPVVIRHVERDDTRDPRRERLSRDGSIVEVRRPQPAVVSTPSRSRTMPQTQSHFAGNENQTIVPPTRTERSEISRIPTRQSPTHTAPAQHPGLATEAEPQSHSQRTPPTRNAPVPTIASADEPARPVLNEPQSTHHTAPQQTHTWQQPEPQVEQRQPIARITRGIENRPAGSPNYRVYSTPSPRADSDPSTAYGIRQAPEQPVTTPAPVTRPTHTQPTVSRSEDSPSYSESRAPSPSQRPQYSAPQQPAPVQTAPAPTPPPQRVESRPAPQPTHTAPPQPAPRSEHSEQRSAPSRSDSNDRNPRGR